MPLAPGARGPAAALRSTGWPARLQRRSARARSLPSLLGVSVLPVLVRIPCRLICRFAPEASAVFRRADAHREEGKLASPSCVLEPSWPEAECRSEDGAAVPWLPLCGPPLQPCGHLRVISYSVLLLIDFISWVALGCLTWDRGSGSQDTGGTRLAGFWFVLAGLCFPPEGADTSTFSLLLSAAHGAVLSLVRALALGCVHSSCALQSPLHTEAPLSSAAASLPGSVCGTLGCCQHSVRTSRAPRVTWERTQPRVHAGARGWGQPEARRCAAEAGLCGGWGAWPAGCDLGFCTRASLPDGNGSQCGFDVLFSQK